MLEYPGGEVITIMDKGILYLLCTAVLVGVGYLAVGGLHNEIQKDCPLRVVYVTPSPAPAVSITATPSAALRSTVKVGTPAAANNKGTGAGK